MIAINGYGIPGHEPYGYAPIRPSPELQYPVYSSGEWISSPETYAAYYRSIAIPQSVSPAQGLIALYALRGITLTDLEAAINSIEDPTKRYIAHIGFSRTTEWRRDSEALKLLVEMLQLSEADVDALFTYGNGVQL